MLAFVLQIAKYFLVAFGILMVSVTIVYVTVFYRGSLNGRGIASILQQTDVPRIVTIILIILSASFLGRLQVIAGEPEIALLSADGRLCAGQPDGAQAAQRHRRRVICRQVGFAAILSLPLPR